MVSSFYKDKDDITVASYCKSCFAATHKAAWKLVPKSNKNSEEEKFKNFRKITDG